MYISWGYYMCKSMALRLLDFVYFFYVIVNRNLRIILLLWRDRGPNLGRVSLAGRLLGHWRGATGSPRLSNKYFRRTLTGVYGWVEEFGFSGFIDSIIFSRVFVFFFFLDIFLVRVDKPRFYHWKSSFLPRWKMNASFRKIISRDVEIQNVSVKRWRPVFPLYTCRVVVGGKS